MKDHVQYDTSNVGLALTLDVRTIWSAFFLHSLLRHKLRVKEKLVVPHHGENIHRLDQELQRRNLFMAGTGQEMWAHACDNCMKIVGGPGEHMRKYIFLLKTEPNSFQQVYMSAGVTDGVSVGHYCCSVQDCTEPLLNHLKRYCERHSRMNSVCAVYGCDDQVENGYQTCNNASHRSAENNRKATGQAMFQLKRRLERAGLAGIVSHEGGLVHKLTAVLFFFMIASSRATEVVIAQESGVEGYANDIRDDTGSTSIKGRFSRRWTHNEQLFVRCCGIIISRATFYGSEGVSGVKVCIY